MWAQNSCCDSTAGPCKPRARSWPFARHTTRTELRCSNMFHASYMQIVSQKVVRGSLRCRWSRSLLVQTGFRSTQVGGGQWCIVKVIPAWTSAETGLWWIVEILSTRRGLMGSSGVWTSSPTLGSAQTAINYPIPLIVPAQEVAGVKKTALKHNSALPHDKSLHNLCSSSTRLLLSNAPYP